MLCVFLFFHLQVAPLAEMVGTTEQLQMLKTDTQLTIEIGMATEVEWEKSLRTVHEMLSKYAPH